MGSILSCGGRMKTLSRRKSPNEETSRVQEIFKYAEWNGYLQKPERLTVVDFSAPWCPPSKYLEPKLNELASGFPNVKFVKINVDKLKTLAKDFEVDVVPTVVLLKQGKPVGKTKGANIEDIKKMIEMEAANVEGAPNVEASKPPPAATN